MGCLASWSVLLKSSLWFFFCLLFGVGTCGKLCSEETSKSFSVPGQSANTHPGHFCLFIKLLSLLLLELTAGMGSLFHVRPHFSGGNEQSRRSLALVTKHPNISTYWGHTNSRHYTHLPLILDNLRLAI